MELVLSMMKRLPILLLMRAYQCMWLGEFGAVEMVTASDWLRALVSILFFHYKPEILTHVKLLKILLVNLVKLLQFCPQFCIINKTWNELGLCLFLVVASQCYLRNICKYHVLFCFVFTFVVVVWLLPVRLFYKLHTCVYCSASSFSRSLQLTMVGCSLCK